MKVNGVEYNKNYFTTGQLLDGATIDVAMDSKPNMQRGTAVEDAPYSFTNELRSTAEGRRIIKDFEKETSCKKK